MRHSNSREAANRHGNGLTRATIASTDDSKLMQEITGPHYHTEQQAGIEHFHTYGFTSRVQPPTMQGSVRRAAEAIVGFLTGNRSHGVVLVVGDRRFRMINLQNGEVAVHDDQGQWVYFRRGGILAKVPNANTVTLQVDQPGAQEGPPSGGNGQDSGQIPGSVVSITLSNSQIAITTQNLPVNVATNGGATNVQTGGGNITLNAAGGTVAIDGGLVDINN